MMQENFARIIFSHLTRPNGCCVAQRLHHSNMGREHLFNHGDRLIGV